MTGSHAPEFLYRFRSLDRILEKKELERQEIFFADPAQLNDPVEGYLDIFWKGDRIVWKSLFKNYLLCLDHIFILMQVLEKETPLTNADIPVHLTPTTLQTDIHRQKYESICADFFADKKIVRLTEKLGSLNREVRRDELLFYLKAIHPNALSVVAKAHQPNKGAVYLPIEKINKTLEDLSSDTFQDAVTGLSKDPRAPEVAFQIGKSLHDQMAMLNLLQSPEMLKDQHKFFAVFEFGQRYVEQLERLMYPPWYAACFMENIENASVWGHYGDSHKGVCLKFRTTKMPEGRVGLNLQPSTAEDGKRGTRHPLRPFAKVNYESKYPSVNFFRSMGSLPIPQLIDHWYTDGPGATSECSTEILNQKSSWHQDFWKRFHESNTTKLKDWSYESEYRLVLSSLFDEIKKEDRVMKYNFADLAGIVFGIKTPLEAKIRIMQEIEKLSDANKAYDIEFFQAAYSHHSGKIAINKLSAFKLSPDKKDEG